MALADAIEESTGDTVIVVHNQEMLELAQRAAARMGKSPQFVIEQTGFDSLAGALDNRADPVL